MLKRVIAMAALVLAVVAWPAVTQGGAGASDGADGVDAAQGGDPIGTVEVSFGEQGLSLYCVNADAHEVFARIGVATHTPIMVNDTVSDRITANLVNVSPTDAIARIAAAYGLSHAEINGVTMISEGIPNGPASYLASEIATVPTLYVPVGRVKSLMPTFLQNHIKTNIEQNAVVLSAPSDVIAKFRSDIKQLDIPAEQIMIEVFMVELTNATLDDLGVQMDWSSGGTNITSDSAGGGLNYHGVTWLPTSFAASLTALASESRAKIRARPRIATVSGQEARVFIGLTRYLSKTVRRLGPQEGGGGEQTFIDAGVTLQIQPFSGTGDIIIVDINEVEISTLSAPDPVTKLPNKTSRRASTEVRVADGQTIVLGGLNQTDSREDEGGIPILRDIPLIGKLFESRHKENVETELVIFITPRKLTRTGHLPAEEEARIGERFGVPLGTDRPDGGRAPEADKPIGQ